ncbi:MAG: hypothetical protein O7A03_02520 [Alphaproteobacteria bacterium]|nr:hypothetical protein [Alphaproteobacteria bacterium]
MTYPDARANRRDETFRKNTEDLPGTDSASVVDRRRMLLKTCGAFAGLFLLAACGPGVALGRRRNAIFGPPGHRQHKCKDRRGYGRGHDRDKCDEDIDFDVDIKVKID